MTGKGPFDPREGADVLARGEGAIRMVTFAPEVQGADELLAGALAVLLTRGRRYEGNITA